MPCLFLKSPGDLRFLNPDKSNARTVDHDFKVVYQVNENSKQPIDLVSSNHQLDRHNVVKSRATSCVTALEHEFHRQSKYGCC